MIHLNVFFNNKIDDGIHQTSKLSELGDLCLSPVRTLFNGKEVSIYYANYKAHQHEMRSDRKERVSEDELSICHKKGKKTALDVIKAIIFFVPGIFVGSLLKSLSYLSLTARENHKLAVKHFTPIDKLEIGSNDEQWGQISLNMMLKDRNLNPLNQKVNNLIIHAKPGAEFNLDLSPKKSKEPANIIHSFRPKKLIIVNGKVDKAFLTVAAYKDEYDEPIENPEDKVARSKTLSKKLEKFECFEKKNQLPQETKAISLFKNIEMSSHDSKEERAYIPRWKMDSVKAALSDKPSRRSFLSPKRYHRIYTVKT